MATGCSPFIVHSKHRFQAGDLSQKNLNSSTLQASAHERLLSNKEAFLSLEQCMEQTVGWTVIHCQEIIFACPSNNRKKKREKTQLRRNERGRKIQNSKNLASATSAAANEVLGQLPRKNRYMLTRREDMKSKPKTMCLQLHSVTPSQPTSEINTKKHVPNTRGTSVFLRKSDG